MAVLALPSPAPAPILFLSPLNLCGLPPPTFGFDIGALHGETVLTPYFPDDNSIAY